MKIGIDLGGTKTEAILIDNNGKELSRKRIATEKNYQGTLKGIKFLVAEFENKFGLVESVGIGMPGAISADSSLVKNANSIWLNGKPLRKDLENQLDKKINLENDANCFALSEAVDGAGKNYPVVFGVIIGTGVGGGIVINKKIHRGANRIAGEWGHHTLYQGGRDCYCGSLGCTESYISGTALEKEWKELTGEFSTVTDIVNNKMHKSHPEWKENFMNNFGRALANVIDILDPDVVVLGGGLSKVDVLYTEGLEAAYKESFSDIVVTPIIKNELGDSGGVFGAAMIKDHI